MNDWTFQNITISRLQKKYKVFIISYVLTVMRPSTWPVIWSSNRLSYLYQLFHPNRPTQTYYWPIDFIFIHNATLSRWYVVFHIFLLAEDTHVTQVRAFLTYLQIITLAEACGVTPSSATAGGEVSHRLDAVERPLVSFIMSPKSQGTWHVTTHVIA